MRSQASQIYMCGRLTYLICLTPNGWIDIRIWIASGFFIHVKDWVLMCKRVLVSLTQLL